MNVQYNAHMSRLNLLKKHRQELITLAQQYGAYNVRIFGSVIRGMDTDDSDIDFLVSFREGTSLFDRGGLVSDFKDYLGCDVDIISDKTIKSGLRDEILSSAQPL